MDDHGEHLAHRSALVDEVGRRALVLAGLFDANVRYDLKRHVALERFVHLSVRLEVFVLLGDRDHHRITPLELLVLTEQLNQLRGAERSPERPVGGDDDVLLAQIRGQVQRGSIGPGQGERYGLVADLQGVVIAPVG